MTITQIDIEDGTDTGGQHLPFAHTAGADGWLFVSGQAPAVNGEVVGSGIVEQSHQTIKNVLAILAEAGYRPEHVVCCDVWLDGPRDFQSFNKAFKEYFDASPSTRAYVVSSTIVDCEAEIDCMAYKKP